METGRKILNLRKDLGVPQKVLAELTAVTPSALSRIEAGIHQPRGPVALRLARELGVTADYLLDDSAPYPPPAREVLSNLTRPEDSTQRTKTLKVSTGEQSLVEAIRALDSDRRVLLEAALNAPRARVRLAAYLVGGGDRLPGVDDTERRGFEVQIMSSFRNPRNRSKRT